MTINIVVLFVIVLVYSRLPLDYITAIACAILAIVSIMVVSIIQMLLPEAETISEEAVWEKLYGMTYNTKAIQIIFFIADIFGWI